MNLRYNTNDFEVIVLQEYEIFLPKHPVKQIKRKDVSFDEIVQLILQEVKLKRNVFTLPFPLIIKKKKESTLYLKGDGSGANPLFYIVGENELAVSLKAEDIAFEKKKGEVQLDPLTIVDMVLFNYPLKERTLNKELKRLSGEKLLAISNSGKELIFLKRTSKKLINSLVRYKEDYVSISNQLKTNLSAKINPDLPILLSMTGGFDSRVNFALLKSLDVPFEAYTFGNPNSNDAAPAQAICKEFGVKHHFIDLNQTFLSNKEYYFNTLIENSLNNPFVLDLAHYVLVNEMFPPSNVITGFMGGEMLTGGSIDQSQVTFTVMAKSLLLSRNKEELKNHFETNFDRQFLNPVMLNSIQDAYLNDLMVYTKKQEDTRSQNIVDFLIQEKYTKFFGVVHSVLARKHNQIDTFMGSKYLENVLNIKSSFTFSKPFERSAINNYHSRRLYAKIIEQLYSPLLNTKLDRGYKVKDLLSVYRLPFIAKQYYLNHTGRGNKLNVKTIDYKAWFSDFIFDSLQQEKGYRELFNFNFINEIIGDYRKSSEAHPISVFNKLVVIYGIILTLNKMKKGIEI